MQQIVCAATSQPTARCSTFRTYSFEHLPSNNRMDVLDLAGGDDGITCGRTGGLIRGFKVLRADPMMAFNVQCCTMDEGNVCL